MSASAWDKIAPYCPSLEKYILDPSISEISVNPDGSIFFERDGTLFLVPHTEVPQAEIEAVAVRIARSLGKDISEIQPLLDARLPDGSRVSAVCPPVSSGWAISIRKFDMKRFDFNSLCLGGMLPDPVPGLLIQAIQDHKTILISGGTGTGKTTLLNAMAGLFHPQDRIVVIEDTSELQIQALNIVKLEAQPAQDGFAAITIQQLVKHSLRMRPERIILGEVRGAEAFDLLQVLNTGHPGSLSTIHANSCSGALSRFSTCALMAGVDLPFDAIKANIAAAVHLVVHIERRDGKRFVSEIVSVGGYDAGLADFLTRTQYKKL